MLLIFFQFKSDLYQSKICCLKAGSISTNATVNNAFNSPSIEKVYRSDFIKARQDSALIEFFHTE